MKTILTIIALSVLSVATTFTVKSSGGNYTSLGTCMNDSTNVHAGDTCQVFASASPQAGWTQTQNGSAGLLISATVNTGDTVTINSTVTISGRSYIDIDHFTLSAGIVGNQLTQHNLITHNSFTGAASAFRIPDSIGSTGSDNVFSFNIVSTVSVGNVVGLYLFGDRNLIDNNTLSHTDGDCMDLGGQNVVVRNNTCTTLDGTSSGQHIDFVQVIGAGTAPTLSFSLIENNTEQTCTNDGANCHFVIIRTGTGPVADTDIIRYNFAQNLDAQGPIDIGGTGDSVPNARAYNNTMAAESLLGGNGSCASTQGTGSTNVRFLNNICYNTSCPEHVTGGVCSTSAATFSPFYDFSAGGGSMPNNNGNLTFTIISGTPYSGGWAAPYSAESTYSALHSQNPLFANYPTDDSIQAGSPAHGAGVALTTVTSGCNSTTLTLADSHFFQPGWSGTQADWIRVGASTTGQISSINYSTNVVTMTGSLACTNGDSVWLYKDSNGNVKINGSANDVGAYQLAQTTVATPSFSPIAGTYTGSQSVTISTSPAGSTICYTTDGSTPTANGAGTCTHGTAYSTPISVTVAETLKAVGSKSGLTDSAVGSAAYVINYTLTVTISSSGTVTSADTDINCPGTCTFAYAAGATSVLTATPTAGFGFTGWTGAGCAGTGTCTVTMSSSQSVTATFVRTNPPPPAAPAIIMSGNITFTGGISR